MTKKPSLAETHPELATQADGWDPSTFSAGSGKKVGIGFVEINLGYGLLSHYGNVVLALDNFIFCTDFCCFL